MTFIIDPDIERRLEALGANTEASKAALLRQAVLEGLEDLEDLQLVEERLSRPEKEYSLEEVERDLGLVD
jgi:predicted DNA-binding protein